MVIGGDLQAPRELQNAVKIAGKEGRFTPAQVASPLNVECRNKLSGGKPPFLTCNFPSLEFDL
jgi:hypothetical protein